MAVNKDLTAAGRSRDRGGRRAKDGGRGGLEMEPGHEAGRRAARRSLTVDQTPFSAAKAGFQGSGRSVCLRCVCVQPQLTRY